MPLAQVLVGQVHVRAAAVAGPVGHVRAPPNQ
jgi:hypothetical protein